MKYLSISALLFLSLSGFAQKKPAANWQIMDPKSDKIYGAATEKALEVLKGRTPKEVIVGVIDSWVEVDHEDLKDVIWVNKGEIPNNGIDDDKNGYIDDINGWSFLGGKTQDLNYESLELARLNLRYSRKFSKMDTTNLKGEDAKLFDEYKRIRSDFNKEQSRQEQQAAGIGIMDAFIKRVKKESSGDFSKASVKSYAPRDKQDSAVKKQMKLILSFVNAKELDEQISGAAASIVNVAKLNRLNTDSIRALVVGDNPADPNERFYGCNRVEGPDALHGTHVSGIIAAMRNNNKGIIGEAPNVKIMAIRAVPNGDERDKDVANGIRYAVDNGASIINMSFGKYYYSDKPLVDEAIKYAMSKDVLLVHAAGNDSKNKDIEDSYPTRKLSDGTIANNWLDVGASASKKGKKLLGNFSNYGKTTVDLFAPGVDIYSTVPDNKYLHESGTSMASPVVAGVAAIIRGYFPELTAKEVREVLMKTSVQYKKKVRIPGSKKQKAKLSDLCISGGLINAENAVKYLLDEKK